jgi:hypothetical protein
MLHYDLSYWERESFLKGIDLAIIGSGIVGLAAALHAKMLRPNLRVAVFERGGLPAGASTRNAGFACFGSMTELLDDLDHASEDDVLGILEKRWRGLQRLRSLVGDANMDFKMLGGYEMFRASEAGTYRKCVEHLPEFNRKIGAITGHPEVYRTVDDRITGFRFRGVEHLILNQAEGQVNTGRMMARLLQMARSNDILLFNGINIQHLEDTSTGVDLHTENGWTFTVPRVLVAVNGFAKRLLPQLDVVPARNQVLITKPIEGLRIEGCFHYDRGYYYFRNIDNRILLGGGRHLNLQTETTDDFGPNPSIRQALTSLLHEVICPDQQAEVESWWTGILGLGPAKKPIIQRLSPHLAVAVRLSGMGVAIGTLVGQEGVELVLGETG